MALSVGGDFSFSISPEALDEKGTRILKVCDGMRETLSEIETAMKGLESWHSGNKVKYEAKVKRDLPSMYELVDVIESYGKVARQTSNKIISTENTIARSILD